MIILGTQFVQFIISGGLEGLAETYEDQGIDLLSLLSNSIPFVVLSFLGVGLGVRRNWRQTCERLGLEQLTISGFLVSIGLTFALLAGLIIFGVIWSSLVPEDVYEEQNQASEALSQSVSSVGLAFAIAASAAIGEELAFRGALQPVLGLWPTAIVFALMHPQYTLIPAALIIFGVALTFGWVRQRYSTTVAILAHFWYNLIQLLTLFLIPEEATEALLHLF
ncbi:MAG: CPBP family intramembrane metalloprotease [Anaerolineae bacterium]|nr:CPBP family intramembrane metalloprotease [Anaerolineae bacterium]